MHKPGDSIVYALHFAPTLSGVQVVMPWGRGKGVGVRAHVGGSKTKKIPRAERTEQASTIKTEHVD